MDIYLAILEDRHSDTQIEPFQTMIKAMEQITKWQTDYEDEKWIKEDIERWEYSIRSEGEDGPYMQIEKKELK